MKSLYMTNQKVESSSSELSRINDLFWY